jgi:hypothetical protein
MRQIHCPRPLPDAQKLIQRNKKMSVESRERASQNKGRRPGVIEQIPGGCNRFGDLLLQEAPKLSPVKTPPTGAGPKVASLKGGPTKSSGRPISVRRDGQAPSPLSDASIAAVPDAACHARRLPGRGKPKEKPPPLKDFLFEANSPKADAKELLMPVSAPPVVCEDRPLALAHGRRLKKASLCNRGRPSVATAAPIAPPPPVGAPPAESASPELPACENPPSALPTPEADSVQSNPVKTKSDFDWDSPPFATAAPVTASPLVGARPAESAFPELLACESPLLPVPTPEPDPARRKPSKPRKRPIMEPPPRSPVALNGSRRLLADVERSQGCAACGGELWHDRRYWVLSCGHIYHQECLAQLFVDDAHTCTACATPLFILTV